MSEIDGICDIFGLDNLNHWSPFSLIGCMGQFGILMTLRFGGPFCAFINKKELQNVTDMAPTR